MSDKNHNKKESSAAAGIAGAIIGAGIAVAATKALSDKKTRAQLKKTAIDVKGKVSKAIEDVKKRNAETKKKAERTVEVVSREDK
jgi:hypothetical protein